MKLKISHFLYATFFSLLVPLFAFADEITGSVSIDKILKAINKEIINPAIIAIFAVALAVFIFGVVRFIWAKQEGAAYEKDGKSHMVWGLVGMFIMASAFGIIQFIANTLTLDFKINNDGTTTTTDPVNPGPGTPDDPGNNPGPGTPDPVGPMCTDYDIDVNGNQYWVIHYTQTQCEQEMNGIFIPPHCCDTSDS